MVTSRSVPQSMAQIFSPFAGQYRSARRFSQMGQIALSVNRFAPGIVARWRFHET
jgi:hypothetical protein